MKKIGYLMGSATAFVLPFVASAQTADFSYFDSAGADLTSLINDVLIPLVLALAFLAFIWGVFQYFIAGGANEEAREKGKNLMIYAIIGFLVIVIFWGIINFLIGITGIGNDAAPTISVPPTT